MTQRNIQVNRKKWSGPIDFNKIPKAISKFCPKCGTVLNGNCQSDEIKTIQGEKTVNICGNCNNYYRTFSS